MPLKMFKVFVGLSSLLIMLALLGYIITFFPFNAGAVSKFLRSWRSLEPSSPTAASEPVPSPAAIAPAEPVIPEKEPQPQTVSIPVVLIGEPKEVGAVNLKAGSRTIFSFFGKEVPGGFVEETVKAHYEFRKRGNIWVALPPRLEGSANAKRQACSTAQELQVAIAEANNTKIELGTCQ